MRFNSTTDFNLIYASYQTIATAVNLSRSTVVVTCLRFKRNGSHEDRRRYNGTGDHANEL